MEIRTLTAADAAAFRAVRLRGLREDSVAFASSYEEEVTQSAERVAERFRTEWSAPDNFLIGAFVPDGNGTLVGVMGCFREQRLKRHHRMKVWAVYVVPEARRQGVARGLLVEIINRARQLPEVVQVELTVTSTNLPAKRLYESLGFRTCGLEPRALKVNGEYHDEDVMVLHLDASATDTVNASAMDTRGSDTIGSHS